LLQFFNLFSFGFIRASQTDHEGRIAAGTTIALTDFEIGLKLFPPNGAVRKHSHHPFTFQPPFTLLTFFILLLQTISCNDIPADQFKFAMVAGQSINLNRGQVHGGNIAFGTTFSFLGGGLNSDCQAVMRTDLIDFNAWHTFTKDLQAGLNALTTTGSVSLSNGVLTFTGTNTLDVEGE
jgi:hypothetical protein